MENHEASATQEPQGSRTALTAHTPGPWRISRNRKKNKARISGRGWEWFCRVWIAVDEEPSPQGEANARLIAAAPDMLDALQSILSHIEPQPSALAKAIATTCRSAIAKATEPK